MGDALHSQLLKQSRRLAKLGKGRPNKGNLRRAVSTAYYALFHFLLDRSSKVLMGTRNSERRFRDTLARAFEHGEMAQACKTFSGGQFPKGLTSALGGAYVPPKGIASVASTFREAQEKRHRADYDRSYIPTKADVLLLIQSVDHAMSSFDSAGGIVDRKFFLHCLLTWKKLERR